MGDAAALSFGRKPARGRPAWRSLLDGAVVLAIAAVALVAAREAGVLPDFGETETGRFTAIDGDSLRKGAQEYRLHAIDAPELHQTCQRADGRDYACGREARQQLAQLTGAGPVSCRVLETDRYQRLVAECRAGGVSLNDAMVRAGWALAYRRHGQDHAAAEAEARKARRGLWQGRFETPEDWRNAHRDALKRSSLIGEVMADD